MLEDYTTIKLPTGFVKHMIDPLVQDHQSGFTSRTEVIKAALRDFVKAKKSNGIEKTEEVPA